MSETMLEQINLEQLNPYDEDDGKDRLAHIVNPPNNLHIYQPGMTAKEIVEIARMQRLIVVALCGYEFIPSHNPERYDACQACMDLAQSIISGMG